jgi:hypothetical protein
MHRRLLVLPVALVLALAGCASGQGGSSSGSSGAGGSSSGGSGSGSTAGAAFTGDLKGSVEMNLCTDSGADSITVHIDGDSGSYVGSVSATQIGFVGPDAEAWVVDKSHALPAAVTAGSGGYRLDGVVIHSTTSSPAKSITVTGELDCP